MKSSAKEVEGERRKRFRQIVNDHSDAEQTEDAIKLSALFREDRLLQRLELYTFPA